MKHWLKDFSTNGFVDDNRDPACRVRSLWIWLVAMRLGSWEESRRRRYMTKRLSRIIRVRGQRSIPMGMPRLLSEGIRIGKVR